MGGSQITTSIINACKWIDHPKKEVITAYKEAVDEYVGLVSKYDEVKAILQIGNVGVAGISDIDLIVFLDDSKECKNNYSFYQINKKFHHILMHDVFISPYRLYEDIHFLAPIFEENLVYVSNLNHGLCTSSPNFMLKLILLGDLIPIIRFEFEQLINATTKSIKLVIARLNALKYPFFLLKDLTESYNECIDIKDRELIEKFIDEFAEFRSDWFNSNQDTNLAKLNCFLYEAHFKIVPLIFKYWKRIIPNVMQNVSNSDDIVKHNVSECLNDKEQVNFINFYLYSKINGLVTSNIKFNKNADNSYSNITISKSYNRELSKRAFLINNAAEFREREGITYGGLWHFKPITKDFINLYSFKKKIKYILAKLAEFLIKHA